MDTVGPDPEAGAVGELVEETIVLDGASTFGADAMLDEERPDVELGLTDTLGARARFSGPPERRTVLRFDPGEVRRVVDGRTIVHAEIRLWSPALAGTFAMHRLPEEDAGWEEARVTWSCASDPMPGNGLPDCAAQWDDSNASGPMLSSFKLFTATPGWAKWQVTSDVIGMVGAGSHPGFIVLGDELNPGSEFVSRESGDDTHHPQLILTLAEDDFAPVEPEVPALDRSRITNTYDAMRFLLDADRGLQLGYDPTAFDPNSAAALRGYVYDRDTGEPLAGVRVTVLGHGELGEVRSRIDAAGLPTGNFEILVNGGGPLTVTYERAGYFTAQRHIDVAWGDWMSLPDVALVPTSEADCTPPITSAGGFFVGPTRTDARGTRTIAFYVPPGTSVAHDGGTLAEFRICSGEYTYQPPTAPAPVDPTEAMPAELPPTTDYTYAAALEVVSGTSTSLRDYVGHPRFQNADGRIYFWLRVADDVAGTPDFMTGAPGGIIPNGLYERDAASWTADLNGISVALTRSATGCSFSTGTAPNPASAAELDELCSSGSPSGMYWRVPFDRFSIRDCNLGFDLGPEGPPEPMVGGGGGDDPDCSSTSGGSILHCEGQTLGESLPLTGTSLALSYLSDHQRGRRDRFALEVTPLDPARPPPSRPPVAVHVELHVAGRRIVAPGSPFTAAVARGVVRVEWDGLDAYRRPVIGPARAHARVGYEYPLEYAVPVDGSASFGVRSRAASGLAVTSRGTAIRWVNTPEGVAGRRR